MRRGREDLFRAKTFKRFRVFAERPGGIDNIIQENGCLPFDVSDDIHDVRHVRARAPFVDDGQVGVEALGKCPRAFHPAGIRRNHDNIFQLFLPYIFQEYRHGIQVIHRNIKKTLDLADVIELALGGRRGAKTHPATRSFQALRIAVNAELSELETGLEAAEQLLKAGGRLAVVTFHSLEDRIVKAFFTERAGRTAGGSRHLPPKSAGPTPTFELLFNGSHVASEAEMAANPRSRSAKLRAGVRTEAPVWRAAA